MDAERRQIVRALARPYRQGDPHIESCKSFGTAIGDVGNLSRVEDLTAAEAVEDVVVDHTGGLHVGVDDD